MHGSVVVKRYGLSLIELLTVLAIVAVLIGIALPAAQLAREAARRTVCLDRLRTIGLGLNHHHSAHDHFPMGGLEWRPPGQTQQRQLAWSAFLLPFLEQQGLYERIDFTFAFDNAVNREAAATVIDTYICPTGKRGRRLEQARGPCDYGGIFGERISGPNQPAKGVMLYDQTIADRDIRDGLSTTFIVAEAPDWPDGQWINGRNLFDQAYPINQSPPFENDIRSDHPGGANACFADGHSQFINQRISLSTLAALCTRSGHEVVDSF